VTYRSAGRRHVIVLVIGSALVGACHHNPEALAAAHLRAGDAYVAQEKYREAIIEFRGALQATPKSGPAHLKLGAAYFSVGDAINGAREQIRAADLMPDDARVQLKAGSVLLLEGRFGQAKEWATKLLARDPNDVDAQILLGNSMAALNDLDAGIAEVEKAIALDPRRSASYATLGGMQMASGDRVGAESAFKHAVDLDPRSVDARLALAQFQLSSGDVGKAEQSLTRAEAIEPASAAAHRALAALYLVTDRPVEAEPHLLALARSSSAVRPKLVLADYYRSMGNVGEARKLLDAIARQPEGHVAAETRIALMQYGAGDKVGAHKTIDEVLARNRVDAEAQLAKAGFLAAERRYADALEHATIAATSAPQLPAAQIMAGSLSALSGRTGDAIRSFEAVLALRPGLAKANVALARLYMERSEWTTARVHAAAAVKAAPRSLDAHVQLARALTEGGELRDAGTELKWLDAQAPDDAAVHYVRGRYYTLTGDIARARTSLTAAVTTGDDLAPLSALVALDLADGRDKEARALVEGKLLAAPDSPPLLVLAATTYDASGDLAAAESALRKAIAADPSYLDAYQTLARLLFVHHRLDEARHEFETLAVRDPKSVAAHTMAGVLLEQSGNRDAAKEHYEQALAIDPYAGAPANNLAWLMAETGGNLDVALQLAQTAKAALPASAEVDDTLGWIYYRKGLMTLAVASFKESVARNPKAPTYQHHLDLASASTPSR